ncbi:putative peptide transport permease protein Mb1314c [Acidimicrobiaceae bacterium]|nr:putative peptide transport permease protein Mb1314c [Acidimicrobiaceae bacterium]
MLGYIFKRFLNFVLLVLIASSMGYFLASIALSPRGNYEAANPPIPKESIDAVLNRANVNDEVPFTTRYVKWAGNVLQGDFGEDLEQNRVNEEFSRRVWVSLRLLLLGTLLGATIGVIVGVISAVRQYQVFDRSTSLFAYFILSTPVFLLAILLKFLGIKFNDTIGSTFFFTQGEYTPEYVGSAIGRFGDRLQHLILPTLSIALGSISFYSRYQRNTMLDVLSSDHLRTARAKGLTRRQALFKHGLRVAISPMATFFAYGFGLLIAGAAFTETIYGWYGMGQWFIGAVAKNDINSVSAVVTFTAVLVLFSGFLADVILAVLDPRVRSRA